MPDRIVPREEWPSFLESFSRQHQGWLVTIETGDAASGDVIAPHEPLHRVSADSGGGVDIETANDRRVCHRVERADPIRLVASDADAEAVERLEISSEQSMTTIRFRIAMPPLLVDGI